MEALRKAEEAKRQAAQKEKDEPDSAAPARAAEALAVDDPVALEAQWDIPAKEAPAAESDIVLDLPSSQPEPERSPSLDVPFDFHIDESFGTLDLKPAAAAVVPESTLESLDPEIDYLKPEDLRQFKPATEPVRMEPAASAGLSLSLEEEPARPETPRAAFIADPEPADAHPDAPGVPEPALELEKVHVPEPLPVVTPQPVLAPIRASRVDEAQEPEPQSAAAPERPRFKVPGIKAAEENRKRESARAVFNAKTGQEPKGRNTRRLIAVAAAVALIPLAGGGYLLVQELGLLGGGNQYNIPASAYNQVPQYPVVAEQPAAPVGDVQLADVTQDLATTQPERVPAGLAAPAVVAVDASADVAPVATEASPLVALEVPVEAPATALEPSVGEVTAPAVAEATAVTPEPEVDLAVPASAEPQVSDNATVAEPSVPTVPVDAIARQETPAPVSGTPAPINITRSIAAPQVNAQLTQAYTAFRDQDYYAARALYQQVLRELPNNRDALLGLAATSIQLGDVTGARATYSKLLELDPRDALARIGLMDSMPLGDSVQMEIQLQGLKAEHPEVAQLSFALGNFYASQRRWNEAQAAYYDALLAAKAESGSAVSPDFAFNLAVSLERLNQAQPAFNFYREALEQSRLVNPGFDVRVLRERLDALERALP